jgi:regulator of replication initiation timing
VDEINLDDLRAELAELVAQEARLSAERERLHHKIDFGFETSTTREREGEVSDRRRELHRRIDALRDQLDARNTAA